MLALSVPLAVAGTDAAAQHSTTMTPVALATLYFKQPSACTIGCRSSRFMRCASWSSSSSTTPPPPRVDISIDTSIGCALVKLNRPEKLNALDLPMFEAIAQAASSLRSERGLRSVIISGQGRAFCSGLDVKSMIRTNPWKTTQRLLQRPSGYQATETSNANKDKGENRDLRIQKDDEIDETKEADEDGSQQLPLPLPALGNLAQDVGYLWRSLPVPVIAVLHGMCYGGGEYLICFYRPFPFSIRTHKPTLATMWNLRRHRCDSTLRFANCLGG